MNTHLTGVCINCGKPKEEHIIADGKLTTMCNSLTNPDAKWMRGFHFYDSGLAALDAHKEELYEACMERKAAEIKSLHDRIDAERKIFSILNQIEKEK